MLLINMNCDFNTFVYDLDITSTNTDFSEMICTNLHSDNQILSKLIDKKYKDIIDLYGLNERDMSREVKDIWLLYLSVVDQSEIDYIVKELNKIVTLNSHFEMFVNRLKKREDLFDDETHSNIRKTLWEYKSREEKKIFEWLFKRNLLTNDIENFDPNNEFLTHLHLMDKCREGEEV